MDTAVRLNWSLELLADDFFFGTQQYSKKFKQILKPLEDYLGITHGIYINVDKNNMLFAVSDYEEWIQRFLEEEYYKIDPFIIHPDRAVNGISFDHASSDHEFKDNLIQDAIVNFNCCHSFVYIEKIPETGGYHGYSFATDKENYKIVNKLTNALPIVRLLIKNLNKELQIIIAKDLEENKMNIARLKGDIFYTQKGLGFDENKENVMKVLKDLQILNIDNFTPNCLSKKFLSPQEINCLRAYLMKHSVKQVARELNLSPTTVTSYLSNIKIKLNCNNKNELLEKGEILRCLRYI